MMRGVVVLGLVLLLGGCSTSECRQAVKKMCAAACVCGAAEGKCALGSESGGLSFDSEGDCRGLFGLGCGSDEADRVDWDACEAALDAPTCTSGRLVIPAACDNE
jgi:hypothetical protein